MVVKVRVVLHVWRNVLIVLPEILALRKGMWEKVASREHDPVKIFPFGAASSELMLYGNVSYQMKSGTKAGLMWAARAVMAEEDGEVKMSYYQVYLVCRGTSIRVLASKTILIFAGHGCATASC